MLEEKLGYRRYDIEPIIEKFYSFLERELKKFDDIDDEDRAQKFDDYIKSNFAKPYDEDYDENDCLFIGTFKGTDTLSRFISDGSLVQRAEHFWRI